MATADTKPKHGAWAIALLVLNLLLICGLWMAFVFAAPVFKKMFEDFGARLSALTQVVIDASDVFTLSCWCGGDNNIRFLFPALWLAVALLGFFCAYMRLVRNGNRKALFLFLWGMTVFFVLLTCLLVSAMFHPIWTLN